MGGDQGPSMIVPAAVQALTQHVNLHLILVGDSATLNNLLEKNPGLNTVKERLSVHHADQMVMMDESPTVALRSKRQSSMRLAINLVKEGTADACVSAGNTGALMAIARFVLKTLPGIERPAIVYALPAVKGKVYMLDLGANAECRPEHLVQFAVMGSILHSCVEKTAEPPRVALLNIGAEPVKGNEVVKQAAQQLQQDTSINYIGYVEGDDIYLGTADVVVCDGFVGNVALKTSEGLSKMILHFAKKAFMRNWYTKFVALLAAPILKSLNKRFDPGQYNGANFLGLKGTVIKSHGNANIPAFIRAIEMAMKEVHKNVPEKIQAQMMISQTMGANA
jgi:glycerol-3-phosphate acyltransferase PlsX